PPGPGNNEATTPPSALFGERRPPRSPAERSAGARVWSAVGSCNLGWPLPGCGPEGRGFESPRSPHVRARLDTFRVATEGRLCVARCCPARGLLPGGAAVVDSARDPLARRGRVDQVVGAGFP